jgi:hypothetical protein
MVAVAEGMEYGIGEGADFILAPFYDDGIIPVLGESSEQQHQAAQDEYDSAVRAAWEDQLAPYYEARAEVAALPGGAEWLRDWDLSQLETTEFGVQGGQTGPSLAPPRQISAQTTNS